MTPTQIKTKMSPAPWIACKEGGCSCGQIYNKDHAFRIAHVEHNGFVPLETQAANIEGTLMAIWGTFGNNINPQALVRWRAVLEDLVSASINNADDALVYQDLARQALNMGQL